MTILAQDILSLAQRQPFLQEDLHLLHEVDRNVPGSIHYSIKRYKRLPQWSVDDKGILEYMYITNDEVSNNLQLKFCLSGSIYGDQKHNDAEKEETIDVLSFSFSPSYLQQFVKANKNTPSFSDSVLSFTHKNSFSKILPLCGKTRIAIDALLNHTYTDTHANIFVNAQMQILLLYSMDCMLGDKEDATFSCKFLSNEADRDKIIKAREILLQRIGEPITIKALSRKVAINECYLKKGFKEIFGTTIFDFYQSQRMEHAKYLLYEKGLSVTEVSHLLGYSSISHFSTAFKKQTGIKPCELLIH